MPPHGQVRAIHLQDQAGFHDLLVFDLQDIGQRRQILLLIRIIFIGLEAGDDAGRRRIHEGFPGAGCFFGGQQVGDVVFQRTHIFDRDGVAHDRPMIYGRAAGIGQALFVGGKIIQVLRRRPRHIADFETCEAMPHVGDIADLAHFAIADDIDAGFHLLGCCFPHRLPHDAVKFRLIVSFVAILRKKLIDHVLGTRHAADMRRQDSFAACNHGRPSLSS